MWGQPHNTSFAIMLENESLLAASASNNTSLSLSGVPNRDEDETVVLSSEPDEDGATSDEAVSGGSGSDGTSERTDQTFTVAFPYPQVDKEFHGLKKVICSSLKR